MSMDYTEFVALANEMIADTGRDVTVVRFRQTPADAAKPWQGPSSPTTVPDATITVKAAFVASGLGFKGLDQDLMKRAKEFLLIGPGASFDLTTANEVIDGGVHKRIEFVEKLAPGSVTVLYIIGIGR